MTTRVLIIEDEEIQRRVLALGLAAEGFEVESAGSVPAAMALLSSGHFDAALVDLLLPGASGVELARTIHASSPGIAIVLMSAYHLSEEHIARLNVGAVGFIPKPYRMQEIARFLREKLNQGPGSARASSA